MPPPPSSPSRPASTRPPSADTHHGTVGSPPPQHFLSDGAFQAWGRKTSKEKKGPIVDVERCATTQSMSLMGKAYRNMVTGEVMLKDYAGFPDFVVTDMWTREGMKGGTYELQRDPYIFRPLALTTRTWMYHYYFKSGKVSFGHSEDAMVRHVLSRHCIDADDSYTGKWASVMFYAPIVFVMCLTNDVAAVLGGLFTISVTLLVTWMMNAPDTYKLTRIVTWPIRAGFFIWTFWRWGELQESTAAKTCGFLLALIFATLEILCGDCLALQAYRIHCNYEVIESLPNRIFICRRLGAAHSQELYGTSLPPDEKITGIASDAWPSDFAIIADVWGLIVELRPLSIADWNAAYEDADVNKAIHRFIGLDVFSPGEATIMAIKKAKDDAEKALSMSKGLLAADSQSQVGSTKEGEEEVHVEDA